jgi:hypothetical protein
MEDSVELRETQGAVGMSSAMSDAQKAGFELHIGSNIFRNTNGVVKVHGKEQIVVELRPDHGLLLLTLDLYSASGTHIAHLRRNVLVLNRTDRFAVEIHRGTKSDSSDPALVRVSDQTTGEIAIEVRALSETRSQITAGKFYSHKGIPVEITPHYCRIGSGTTRFGDIVENRGGSVTLD